MATTTGTVLCQNWNQNISESHPRHIANTAWVQLMVFKAQGLFSQQMNSARAGFFPSRQRVPFWPRVYLQRLSRSWGLEWGPQDSTKCAILLWLSRSPSCKTKSSLLFPPVSSSGGKESPAAAICTAWDWRRGDARTPLTALAGVSMGLVYPKSADPSTVQHPSLPRNCSLVA